MRYVLIVCLALSLGACQKGVPLADNHMQAEVIQEPEMPDPYTRSELSTVPRLNPVVTVTEPPKTPPVLVTIPPPRQVVQESKPSGPVMSPAAVIEKANAAARVKPQLDAYINGEQRYTFEAGNLYPIYAAKGRVTTIILEPGEEISENGFYAADLQNWQYEPSGVMGNGPDERPVVVIMPYHASIRTNLSIATNRRLYLLELRAFNTTYMPAVSWHYPERDQQQRLSNWREQQSQRRLMQSPRVNPEKIRTPYTIKAIKAKKGLPEWMPREAMHDGRRTYITFAPEVIETPALFTNGPEGLEVVQFRIRTDDDGGMTYIADQVLDKAELRLIHGEQEKEPGTRVVIEMDHGSRHVK